MIRATDNLDIRKGDVRCWELAEAIILSRRMSEASRMFAG